MKYFCLRQVETSSITFGIRAVISFGVVWIALAAYRHIIDINLERAARNVGVDNRLFERAAFNLSIASINLRAHVLEPHRVQYIFKPSLFRSIPSSIYRFLGPFDALYSFGDNFLRWSHCVEQHILLSGTSFYNDFPHHSNLSDQSRHKPSPRTYHFRIGRRPPLPDF